MLVREEGGKRKGRGGKEAGKKEGGGSRDKGEGRLRERG
jgi:hypothetical protein